MVFCSTLGALAAFLVGIFNPRIANKAGPDWLWLGGRDDVDPATRAKSRRRRAVGLIAARVRIELSGWTADELGGPSLRCGRQPVLALRRNGDAAWSLDSERRDRGRSDDDDDFERLLNAKPS